MINSLSSGVVLCSEVLHDDLLHRARLISLIACTPIDSDVWVTLAVSRGLFEDEILKRIDRLGGMAGEW